MHIALLTLAILLIGGAALALGQGASDVAVVLAIVGGVFIVDYLSARTLLPRRPPRRSGSGPDQPTGSGHLRRRLGPIGEKPSECGEE